MRNKSFSWFIVPIFACLVIFLCLDSVSADSQEKGFSPLTSLKPPVPTSIRENAEALLLTQPDKRLQQKLQSALDDRQFSTHIRIPLLYRGNDRLVFVFEYVVAPPGQRNIDAGRILYGRSAFLDPQQHILWIKLMMAISELSNLPVSSITGKELSLPIFVWVEDGVFHEADGTSYFSIKVNITAATVEVIIPRPKPRVAPGLTLPLPKRVNFARVSDLAQNFFRQYGVAPGVSDRTDRHVIVGAYGLKNVVVLGENLWEKISFFISDVSDNREGSFSLYVVADGYFTSALGTAPPTTTYMNSFEPKYYKQLDGFTKTFGEYLRKELSTE